MPRRSRTVWSAARLDVGAAAGAELVEGAAAVSLHGVLADEEGFTDLAVAEATGHELEDFEFAAGDAEPLARGVVGGEAGCGGGGDFNFDDSVYDAVHDSFAGGEQPGAEPDAGAGKEDGDQDAVDRNRVLEDEEMELGPLEQRDEDAAYQPEDQHLFAHAGLSRGSCCP